MPASNEISCIRHFCRAKCRMATACALSKPGAAQRAALRLSESRASTFPCFHGGITMIKTKTQRYDTTVLDARALADALEIEE